MKYDEFDENSAIVFMQMLQEGPTMRDIVEKYPGVDNFVHVMTAQAIMHFILPFLEDNMSVPDLVEAIRKYLLVCIAMGINLSNSDEATEYVLNLYNKPAYGEGQSN